MKIVHAKTDVTTRKIYAAGENVFADDPDFGAPELENDAEELDESGEEVDDEGMGEDGQQDGSAIEVDNNIFNHLIAECQNCHGIFISAMIASDQDVESVNGVCPLCSKETEQFFIGIIKEYPEADE